MWSVAIYYVVLLLTVAVAVRHGGPLERWAAYTALIASVLTTVVTPFPTWTNIEVNIFIVDVLVLLSFWFIALRTQSFWPYWITGWQLIAIFGHIQKLMFVEILARPYSLLSMYISYPILLLIIYASGSSGRRKDVAA
ncbi:hypothetical protein [Sphingopyxis alaskensis]|jgi:hypothetical protein|uniref:Uncharacterized protein n=1 Tax=Sphingopyxis alaskensis (strain DSM 13593 / LMG 18877 / RB2256) TaxID=317655 RepID=Q1GP17_SPHAL|nr:hypothetical protein [Sphingopyxis alaskensis]ABF54605.1 hypothetical protein Sala_2900 [Sphingopyxis alaskensis RB2256]MCM3418555.1 hypothetical protein [Sphingopyxis alaskensis]